MKYGWWSQSQSKFGYCIYSTLSGKEVKVSMVSDTINHNTKLNDIKCVGEVETFIRRIPGLLDKLFEENSKRVYEPIIDLADIDKLNWN